VDVLTPAHKSNRLLTTWPSETLAYLGPHLKQIALGQGTVLLEPGDEVDQIYFPQSGLISLLVVTSEGSTIETSTVGREGALGLNRGLGARRSFTRAIVQVAGAFLAIRATHLERVVQEHAQMRDLIVRYIEVQWAESQQTVACNAVHDASARLCRWLLQCADRLGSDSLALTQEFLSQMLGVRRTTVTLLAQALQAKGIIKYRRGHILIVDRQKLMESACECYQIIKDEQLPQKLGIKL